MTDRSNLAAIVALVWVFLLDGCGDAIQKRRHELCTFALANRQLDPSAKIDGRIAVVYLGGGYDPKFDNGCDIDGYSGGYKAEPRYFPVQMYAQSPDEIDTLVIIALRKGDFIKTTNFQMTQSVGWTTDVYAGQLVISVINFKTLCKIRCGRSIKFPIRSRLRTLSTPSEEHRITQSMSSSRRSTIFALR